MQGFTDSSNISVLVWQYSFSVSFNNIVLTELLVEI